MTIDLHTHSNCSDGTDTPAQLIGKAAAGGLSAVALTDHDTMAGVPEAMEAAEAHGIELVTGVELSCDWQPGTMHMLVLFLDPGPGPFQDKIASLQAWRSGRNRLIVERLAELGIDITMQEVLAEADGGGVGRPHFAAILVRKGVVSDFQAAFDEYLGKGRSAYVDRERLTPEDAIFLARASGAVPVLAHPHTLGLPPEDLRGALERLARAGLVGMEAEYSDYIPEERRQLAGLARELALVPSGGSDYHGDYKPRLMIGRGQGDLQVPYRVLEELTEARGRILAATPP